MTPVHLPQLQQPVLPDGIESLRDRIDGDVRTARHDRMLYATDASIYQVEPLGVVIPHHLDDVRAVVSFAAEHRIPILPRGGGTSLAGQTVNRALVLDLSHHCNELISIDVDQRQAVVEPGIVLDQFNAALHKHGLMFGPDVATASHANIGGMIGNNSAGAHSVLYGRTVEHLLGLDALLADGRQMRFAAGTAERDPDVMHLTRQVAAIVHGVADEIRRHYPKITRHVDGYNLDIVLEQLQQSEPGRYDQVNLAHLMCGSEGTLSITLQAELKLVPAPRHKALAMLAFADVDSALQQVQTLLETSPAAVELIDDIIVQLARQNNEYRRYVELLPTLSGTPPGAVLYVEYFADDAAQLAAKLRALDQMHGPSAMVALTDSSAMTAAWKLRKAGEPLLYGMTGLRKPITFIEDAAVAPARLVEFVREIRALLGRHGTTASFYAHASVGCLHIRPMIGLANAADRRTMQLIAEETCDLVRRFDGALSGEHGDGRLRSHLLERYFGPVLCEAFAKIKAVFDPNNLMNPGNIVTPQPMTENLRARPYDDVARVPEVQTYYKYEAEGDFAEAVHLCNGAGVCRKTTGGTMCPSFRALRDERHATRGRGNALRLAITGQLHSDENRDHPSWNDAETIQTLDLCLSCKACKSECPSNVDVARLKAEYMAQSYDVGRAVPWSARLFSHVRTLNSIGSAVHPLGNVLIDLAGGPACAMLGIDRRRRLPRFGPSLLRWRLRRTQEQSSRPVVLLVADCFTTYTESHIGRAAVLVLEALGYCVKIVDAGCCQRPAISLGLLRDALPQCAESADALIAQLGEYKPVAVVALEPSCVSAIIDDWLDLRLNVDQPRLHELAARTMSIEDFIEAHWDEHPQQPAILRRDESPARVVLHGHCHQKALWGVEQTVNLLQRCIGDRVTVLDSGCCGMAGAFGYTAEHYDLSMAVGEAALFPLLREQLNAQVCAPGTSCRHQIHEALGRTAQHPIELVAQAFGVRQ